MPTQPSAAFRRAPAFPLPTVADVEDALDRLLIAIEQHEIERAAETCVRKPAAAESPLAASSLAELMTDVLPGEPILRDPVGRSLREGITMLGKTLHALTGSTVAMRSAMHRVCDRDPARRSRRVAIIERRWCGIGGWRA